MELVEDEDVGSDQWQGEQDLDKQVCLIMDELYEPTHFLPSF